MMEYKKELKELILTVIKEGASDLHLSVGVRPAIRVNGSLMPLAKRPVLAPEDSEGLILLLLSDFNQERLKTEKEVDFSYSFEDKARFRGNAFYQKGFLSCSLRLIPPQVKELKSLNLPETILQHLAYKEQGFFLVVGPIGHGKSTTLSSMIDFINHTRSEHILTIEDPIEYLFIQDKSIIEQREVFFDTTSFHRALRSMFREDVNVAMIGEMRDTETISTAITAAETGHLILSSLHTNSAGQTVNRIIDSFPPAQQNQIRIQLSSSLLGIFSQRLLPRISGGLIPAYELLINNNAVSNLIREARIHEIDTVIETSLDQGMVSLNRSLVDLVRRGEITIENAIAFSLNPKELQRVI
ncbi:MAG: type IV pili twitching motility protein PilT [Candidatus Tagabacteria bacterium CG_4_10_14_0_2_um_filter_40_13]|uniref:Type IV pili twitching motility protein PilT n=1 Tax=Candidatus Tagabacteria bacterium CG03_land_8_20_14_0_80_41_22 TaxID=1975020 RepID=A0A2M7B9D2_9BACT|nr:MAG: type IV pili twitching motility protein PilT [Candidatus Tagabacteria bacterium CG11_big_fil_rev_8_21_14_0_20_41_11]PIU99727.1 MAG: type IV pili twitching motility protein PilT [Candidatus Tagabacteria bacterium CG03_land_8_20_14_0_80_41_22]PIZ56331.1 MAG: type IV pili twitching motility protein PilT [Candidatus Tagabacteria bacterium CG_4_10_14_0_2_um_filter_40_13]